MNLRHAWIAVTTAAALAIGLPALGSVLPVYSIGWEAAGEAYATVDGACGFVDPPAPEGETRHLTFCFGDTIESEVHAGGGDAGIVAMWVRDLSCFTDGDQQFCNERRHTFSPDEVDFTVSPLLDQATASGGNPFDCQDVDLVLTATAEPSLDASPPEVNHGVEPGPDAVRGRVSFGPGSASVGRDASVSGVLCGVTIGAGEGASEGASEGEGRILRGLGTAGGQAEFDVK